MLRIRYIGIALFFFISAFAFSQVKVNIEIEGNGTVFVQDKSFQGAGLYEFEVGEYVAPYFRIKPGKQFYLDGLLDYSLGRAIPVSRDNIYAERDDMLHYYHYGPSYGEGYSFHFVFKEVQPWQEGEYSTAYRSKDLHYAQIYRPSELCDTSVRSDMTASIQNDLEFAPQSPLGSVLISPYYKVLNGNNKTIKNAQGLFFPDEDYLPSGYNITINNLHFLNEVPTFHITPASISGTTMNFAQNNNNQYVFNAHNLQNCINFGERVGHHTRMVFSFFQEVQKI